MRQRKRLTVPEGVDPSPGGWIQFIALRREEVASFDRYPYSIPAIRSLKTLQLHPKVTFLIGENGSGKSTLIEAIAVAAGFNAEGGSKDFRFETRNTESGLGENIQVARRLVREEAGFFLRAESFYNVATEIERLGMSRASYYGGKSMHEQSHGESFLALAMHRFWPKGLYILDEPEAALSPQRQLSMVQIIHHHVTRLGSQFIIATHSPIIMAYPNATIYRLSGDGIEPVAYEETDHYTITRDFLNNRETYLRALMDAAAVFGEDEE